MALRIRKRQTPLRFGTSIVLPPALLFAFFVAGLLLLLQDKEPIRAFAYLFEGGFWSRYAIEDTLVKTIPLFLCSLGVSIAFRMQIWNIGAEGQYALGGIGATAAVLLFPDMPEFLLIPTALFFAALAGGVWGFVPGMLKLKFGLNEIISTLMLNYIGIELLRYLVYGPWKDASSMGFPMTMPFPPNATLDSVWGRVHEGIWVCLIAAIFLAVFLSKTRLGFEIKTAGENPRAARYARMPYGFLLVFVLALSGAFAGIAGGVEVSATFQRLQPTFCTGYGYTAIVVAWLSQLKIHHIAFFAFFLAGIRVGVENMQLEMQVPAAFGGILEGLILLTVLAGQFFYTYKLEWVRKEQMPNTPDTQDTQGQANPPGYAQEPAPAALPPSHPTQARHIAREEV